MKNLTSILLCVILLCLSACSNNDDLVEINRSPTSLKYLAKTSTFNYQGKSYSSEFNYTNDSSIIYIDEEVQKIAEKLDQNPVLVIFFNAGTVTYYDNESEFDKTLNLKSKSYKVATREGGAISMGATFYKDADYKGAQLKLNAGNYPDLNSYGFNDCISSLKASVTLNNAPVGTPFVRLYADKNYGGRMYPLQVTNGSGWNNTYIRDIANLASSGMNDQTSSIKIEYVLR